MSWTEGDVVIGDGIRLHYYRRGTGRPVVLAHGATDNGKCWERVASVLEADYELIAFDARFHGRSDAPADGQFGGGDDLVALVQALGIERPALLGHSMGANTVAQASSARPELFRCAILEDPPWWEEPPTGARPPGIDYSKLSEEQIIAEGRKQTVGWDDAEFPAWAESKKQFRPPTDWMAGFGRRLGQWRQTVTGMNLPTLLICGDQLARGAIVTKEVAAEACLLAPSMSSVTLAGAGHNVRREAFGAYVATVRGFLEMHQ
jgi:N-formylmaleamate deformylase